MRFKKIRLIFFKFAFNHFFFSELEPNKFMEKVFYRFHAAAWDGKVDAVKEMLKDGVPVNVTNGQGYTALHQAAQCNRTDVVECLLRAGASINQQDESGDTPLHLAVRNKSSEVTELLVDMGAKVELRNKWNLTPFADDE